MEQKTSWCEQKITNKAICTFNKYAGAEITLLCIVIGALFLFRKKVRPVIKTLYNAIMSEDK